MTPPSGAVVLFFAAGFLAAGFLVSRFAFGWRWRRCRLGFGAFASGGAALAVTVSRLRTS
jgi:hypothetical protein